MLGRMPTLELQDGCRLSYDVAGDGQPVLLIQGVGVIGSGYRPQVGALSSRHRVAWFDNRGVGRSTLVGALSIERMAGDALALMDHLGFDRAHVVGHSMGGVIAQELALRAPERVRSLSLLCTFSRGAEAVTMSPWLIWIGLRTRIGTRRMRRLAFLEMVTPRAAVLADAEARAAELEAVFERGLEAQPKVAMTQLRALARHDASSWLGAIAAPTLVVSATEDRIARPEYGRRLAAAIPGARYVEIPGSHAVTVHDATRINALLLDHLEATRDAAAA